MRVLITGGLGYLGGRLAQFFASRVGYEIILGSRQQAEAPSWCPPARVAQMRWDSKADLEEICEGVDAVIHLAGMNAQDCAADPIAALEVNAVASARLLKAAVQQGVKRFIYLSTAHVYGDPLAGVITEETCPVSLHPYATSHRAGEDMVLAAHQRGEIEGVVIRLSNAYGAPAHRDTNCWKLLVNDLCRQAVMNQGMVLRSSGLQRRDFVPLRDACCAIEHLLHQPVRDLGNGLFNVGGECVITVWEMAQRIAQSCRATLGYTPEITRPEPAPNEYATALQYDISKLKRTGFCIEGDADAETVQILKMCVSMQQRRLYL